jgi:hypothetical protein
VPFHLTRLAQAFLATLAVFQVRQICHSKITGVEKSRCAESWARKNCTRFISDRNMTLSDCDRKNKARRRAGLDDALR